MNLTKRVRWIIAIVVSLLVGATAVLLFDDVVLLVLVGIGLGTLTYYITN